MTMRTEILIVLLFVVASASVLETGDSDKAEDGQRGMCLGEFLEKHPELKETVEKHFQKKSKKWKDEKGREGHSKHHSHHYQLPNCTADEDCASKTICCKMRCGAMKCVKPIFSDKDIEWLHKDDKEKSQKIEAEEVSDTAEDGKRGMCLGEFLEKHPELKDKVKEHFQKKIKKWNKDKGWEGHWKPHFHHFSNLQNCTADEDCSNKTICCKTRHGSMKCMKPIISKKDLKWLHDDDDDDEHEGEEEVSDKAEDGKRGMCLEAFLEKHPELKEKVDKHFQKNSKNCKEDKDREGNSKHHFHHFFDLQNCTADEDCSNNTICCKMYFGAMKCVKPIFSKNDIKWLHKDDKKKSWNKRESEELSDKSEGGTRGMCFGEFLDKHPELKEKVEEHFQKKSKKLKGGEEHSKKHHSHRSPNCTSDEECTDNTICCKTWSGSMKCKKPIFSEKDIEWLHNDDNEKNRNKREAEEAPHGNVVVKVVKDDETYGTIEASVQGYVEGEEHQSGKNRKKGFKREKLHHSGPIKGKALVDEKYIKQGSNGKTDSRVSMTTNCNT